MRLWGRKTSINTQKVLWCLAELGMKEGQDFERIDAGLHFGHNHTPAFLKLNPNGLVPLLEDGDLVLWESHTILRYLVDQYDTNHFFSTDISMVYQSEKWLDWKLGTMWPILRVAFFGLTRQPEEQRDYRVIQKAYQDTNQLLGMLDSTLERQAYCAGNQFSLGDIPLVLGISRWILLHESFAEKTGPRTPYQNIDAWIKRLETNTNYSIVAENTLNIVK